MKFSVGDIAICTSYGGSRNHDWVGQEVEISEVTNIYDPYPYAFEWLGTGRVLCRADELELAEETLTNTLEDWS